ncbi:hypothetical protein LX64_01127 [Chitinophaga skermanii]|uniref:Uncharacterized protein n=1 Tax=Chitinophaga skermanii TaxID=331697 RepID=A0A327QWY8_9BACT|nr:hypothetical protein [Chitinophaga skermanii]RAJ08475.1 hypothetical protein LX64_01127 [Chitinophaga skermanii]
MSNSVQQIGARDRKIQAAMEKKRSVVFVRVIAILFVLGMLTLLILGKFKGLAD